MGLLDKLTSGTSQLTGLDGGTPNTPNFQQSTLTQGILYNWRS